MHGRMIGAVGVDAELIGLAASAQTVIILNMADARILPTRNDLQPFPNLHGRDDAGGGYLGS